jgi:hypothetical protein
MDAVTRIFSTLDAILDLAQESEPFTKLSKRANSQATTSAVPIIIISLWYTITIRLLKYMYYL